MSHLDPFTRKRLEKFITDFRSKSGELPTLKDLADSGFEKDRVDAALKDKVIAQSYLTLTNGTIVKGYVLHVE